LDSYLLKLERAKQHLTALRKEEKTLLATSPGRIVPEYDTSSRRITMVFRAEEPPQTLGPVIGDPGGIRGAL
jgi:hypothetical protein